MLHALLLGSGPAATSIVPNLLGRFQAISGVSRGSQAMALVARRPVHVVVAVAPPDDMTSTTFAANVRRWHPRRRPRLVSMNPADRSAPASDVGFDATLAPSARPEELADALFIIATAAQRAERQSDELRGSFDGVDFAALVQVIAQGEKTGRLEIEDGRFGGSLLYREGVLIHAMACGLEGPEAFRFLLNDLSQRPRTTFSFAPLLPGALTSVDPTIACQVDRLLLEAA